MKLAAYVHEDRPRLGVVSADALLDVASCVEDAPADMITLIRDWDRIRPRIVQSRAPDRPLAAVKLCAPVLRPGKILAIGLNYLDHIEETGAQRPVHPTFFAKMPTAANGPFDPIEYPVVSAELDYEAELVVVIGKYCRNVPRERAKEVIFGYCAGNSDCIQR